MDMRYLIEQCIFPIIDGNDFVGQGFVADGYFITSAYIVRKFPHSFIDMGRQRILFAGLEPVYIGEGNVESDPKVIDIAVFRLINTPSFLHLSTRKPDVKDILKSYCIKVSYNHNTGRYDKELSVCSVSLYEEADNYFYCKCKRNIGSSGSPLVIGTDVVGILHSGDLNNICAFLKPISFMLPESISIKETIFNNVLKPASVSEESIGSSNKSIFDKPEEPWTPEYFNRKAREQIGDAFE